MNKLERTVEFDKFVMKARKIINNKNADYSTGKEDKEANYAFKMIAELLKDAPITPYTVGMVFKLKHVFSLLKFCKTGKQESGEGLEGRHIDDFNYTFILSTLIKEHLEYFNNDVNPENEADIEDEESQEEDNIMLFYGDSSEKELEKFDFDETICSL